MKYRPEIDGLRAVAILPVILFHAGIQPFTGGFVGVDVFFVISGYLITTIILQEKETGHFSVLHFYERRARRILPALFLVMLCCIPFAWRLMLPGDMQDFAQSVASVTVFASNILFWRENGYFASEAELKPLLHTWTLAVEEQYYLLFPLFIMLVWRSGKKWMLACMVLGGIASLLVAEWGLRYAPAAAFYLLPTRGWELVIGACAAVYLNSRQHSAQPLYKHRVYYEIMGFAGIALIFHAIFNYSETTPFPGIYALAPTVGAVLIILFAHKQTLVARILSFRLFVGIGLVSYSAYLWHQPLFAFSRHWQQTPPAPSAMWFLCAMTMVLAYLSWQFVERPFRQKNRISTKAVWIFAGIGSLGFMAFGLTGHVNGGYPNRGTMEASQAAKLDDRLRVNRGLNEICDNAFTQSPLCHTSEKPEVLLWGDSYAMHLAQGLQASNPDVALVQMTKSACGPFIGTAPGTEKYGAKWPEGCRSFNQKVMEWIRSTPSLRYAVLASTFRSYVSGNSRILMPDNSRTHAPDFAEAQFIKTLEALKQQGIHPVIVAPPPQNGLNIGRCLTKALFFGKDANNCYINRRDSDALWKPVIRFLQRIDKDYDVIWLTDTICEGDICPTLQDNIILYRDGGHLTHEGSAYLGRKLNFYPHGTP